jgi:hypothetical protein
VKRIIIVAIAALALTAAFGSGSASANTVLCKTASNPCPKSDIQPAGSWFTVAGADLSLKGTWDKLTCYNFALGSRTIEESGYPLNAIGESGPVGPCALGSNSCEASMTSTASRIYGDSYHNGIIVFGSQAEPVSISYECTRKSGILVKCTYTASAGLSLWITKSASLTSGTMTKTGGNSNCLDSTVTYEYKEGSIATGNYLAVN